MSATEARQRAIEWLERQIAQLAELRNANPRDNRFKEWRQTTLTTFQRIWPNDPGRADHFRRIRFTAPFARPDEYEIRDFFQRGGAEAMQLLRVALIEVTKEGVPETSLVESGSAFEPGSREDDFPTLELPASGGEAVASEPAAPASGRVPMPEVAPDGKQDEADLPAVAKTQEVDLPVTAKAQEVDLPVKAKTREIDLLADAKAPQADVSPVAKHPRAVQPYEEKELLAADPAPPVARELPAADPAPPAARELAAADPAPFAKVKVPHAEGAPATKEPPARPQAPSRAKPTGKGAKGSRKAGSHLRDMLGFDEDTASGAPAAAEVRTPPAAPEAHAPAAADVRPPAAPAVPAEEMERPAAESLSRRSAGNEAADFLSNSPVFQSRAKPVRRRRTTASFNSPVAIALAALADDPGSVGVAEPDQGRVRSELTTLARHLDARDLDWARLRAAIEFVLEFPGLARRVLPLLLPHLDQAA